MSRLPPRVLCLRLGREARQRVAVEGPGLPRARVPLAVACADHLDGDEHPYAADLVLPDDAVVRHLPVRADGEPERAREVALAQNLNLVLARVLVEEVRVRVALQIGRASCRERV